MLAFINGPPRTAPNGSLIMAHVTTFYDDYRADGTDFFAYPDFFAFQKQTPLADYAMFDIWPNHKIVHVDPDHTQVLQAINDRGVNVLLVPDGEPKDLDFDRIVLASARRNIDQCYVYALDGPLAHADVSIRCERSPFVDWVENMFNTIEDDAEVQKRCRTWVDQCPDDHLEQSYRRVNLDEALARL